MSLPAQVDLHLSPGDVRAFLCHRLIERRDILGVFERLEHPLVLLGTYHDSGARTTTLDEHRFALCLINNIGQVATSVRDADSWTDGFCHVWASKKRYQSTNPMERVNKEVKRRTDVVSVFRPARSETIVPLL